MFLNLNGLLTTSALEFFISFIAGFAQTFKYLHKTPIPRTIIRMVFHGPIDPRHIEQNGDLIG